ncbi:hypothetical protein CF327_g6108 [Tilletia walkeri]|nr:hypothetical protein CF327_g6108 [Tilletia walkeri]
MPVVLTARHEVDPRLADVTIPFLAVGLSFILNGIIFSLAILYACNSSKKDSRVLKLAVLVCVVSNAVTLIFRMYRAQSFIMGDLLTNLSSLKWDYVAYMIAFAPVRTITQIYFGRRAWILDGGNGKRSSTIKWIGVGIITAEGLVGMALPITMLATFQPNEPGRYGSPFMTDVVKGMFVAYNVLNVILQGTIAYLFASALKRMDTALKASRDAVKLLTRTQLGSAVGFCAMSAISIFTFIRFRLPSGRLTDLYVLPISVMEDMFAISFLLALIVREDVRSRLQTRGDVDILSPEAGQLFFFQTEEEFFSQQHQPNAAPSSGWIPFWSLVHSRSTAVHESGPPPISSDDVDDETQMGLSNTIRKKDSVLSLLQTMGRRRSSGASLSVLHFGGRRRSSGASSARTRVA